MGPFRGHGEDSVRPQRVRCRRPRITLHNLPDAVNTRRGSGQTVNGKRHCRRVCDIEIITARSLSPTGGGYESTIEIDGASSPIRREVTERKAQRDGVVASRNRDNGFTCWTA